MTAAPDAPPTVTTVETSAAEPVVVAAPVIEPAPAIDYKRADASKLAGAVAKEVGKTLAPIIGVVLLALAIVIYLIAR